MAEPQRTNPHEPASQTAPKPPPWSSPFARGLRYALAAACLLALVLWRPAEPPEMDWRKVQVVEGRYQCVWRTGGSYGPSGVHMVDGVPYYGRFSHLFGISPGLCFKELDGRAVRLYFLPVNDASRRLTLEVSDLKTGQIFGVTKEQHFANHQRDVASMWPFYLSKAALLVLALRLTCWNWLKELALRLGRKTQRM